jgi:uncharacterized protein (TIGR00251 family)
MENRKITLAAESQMSSLYRVTENVLHLYLRITPGAPKDSFTGIRDGRLCVHVAAHAENGKANDSLRAFLAGQLGCAKRDIAVIKGEKTRLKTVSIPLPCKDKLEGIVNFLK